jgi:Outer membrane protein
VLKKMPINSKNKMSMKTRLTIIIGIFLINVANAQENRTQLTIQEAIKLAMEKNPEINQLKSQLRQKEVEIKSTIGINDPTLTYSKEGMPQGNSNAYTEQRITIEQSIDFPLTSYYRNRKVSDEKKSLEFQLQWKIKTLNADIKNKYIHILYSIYLRNLRQKEIVLANNLKNIAQLKSQSGVGNDIDLLSSELRLEEANNNNEDAEQLLHEARYSLFNAIGLNPEDQRYDISFTDTLLSKQDNIPQEEALEYLDKQPQYLALSSEIAAAKNKVNQANSSYLPNLKFSYYLQNYGGGYNFRGYQVGVSIPLWGYFNQHSMVQLAKAQKVELEWKQESVYLEMKKRIEIAWHSYYAAKNKIDRFESSMKEKSERLQSLTFEAYRLGQINMVTLIDAQKLYLSSQEHYLTALRDYYLTLIELEQYVDFDIVI